MTSADNAGYPVVMVADPITVIPDCPFPGGFGLRTMTERDIGLWTDIQRDAEPYLQIADDQFEKAFGRDWGAAWERCFLVTAPRGLAVGTISAWWEDDWRGGEWGRLHWLSIRPACQRLGLAKAASAAVLQILAARHGRAFLDTQSSRIVAIRMYRALGFAPLIAGDADRAAWEQIDRAILHNHPSARE